ncbi:MAG: hypothetical protein WA125_00760 [Desulfosporosinus sp.]
MRETCGNNLEQRFEQLTNLGLIYFQDAQALYGDIKDSLNVLNIKLLNYRKAMIKIASASCKSRLLNITGCLHYWKAPYWNIGSPANITMMIWRFLFSFHAVR